jgi:hypothetical protein
LGGLAGCWARAVAATRPAPRAARVEVRIIRRFMGLLHSPFRLVIKMRLPMAQFKLRFIHSH